MINQHFYIARLIARYLSDEIEEEEQAEQRRTVSVVDPRQRMLAGVCLLGCSNND